MYCQNPTKVVCDTPSPYLFFKNMKSVSSEIHLALKILIKGLRICNIYWVHKYYTLDHAFSKQYICKQLI